MTNGNQQIPKTTLKYKLCQKALISKINFNKWNKIQRLHAKHEHNAEKLRIYGTSGFSDTEKAEIKIYIEGRDECLGKPCPEVLKVRLHVHEGKNYLAEVIVLENNDTNDGKGEFVTIKNSTGNQQVFNLDDLLFVELMEHYPQKTQ